MKPGNRSHEKGAKSCRLKRLEDKRRNLDIVPLLMKRFFYCLYY